MTLNIFTTRDNKLEPSKDKESMKESFDQMKDLLKQKFPRLDVSVNIFWIPANLMHDRYIFTNFYYINAGAGFILYDSNGKLKKQKSNNLQVFLIKDFMSFDNYKKRLLEVKTWLKDYSTTLEY